MNNEERRERLWSMYLNGSCLSGDYNTIKAALQGHINLDSPEIDFIFEAQERRSATKVKKESLLQREWKKLKQELKEYFNE